MAYFASRKLERLAETIEHQPPADQLAFDPGVGKLARRKIL